MYTLQRECYNYNLFAIMRNFEEIPWVKTKINRIADIGQIGKRIICKFSHLVDNTTEFKVHRILTDFPFKFCSARMCKNYCPTAI